MQVVSPGFGLETEIVFGICRDNALRLYPLPTHHKRDHDQPLPLNKTQSSILSIIKSHKTVVQTIASEYSSNQATLRGGFFFHMEYDGVR